MIYAATRSGLAPLRPRPNIAGHTHALGLSYARPLIEAAADDVIDLIVAVDPLAVWPEDKLRHSARATVVLLADNTAALQDRGGPTAWQCADHIGGWCAAALIHAAGATEEHYQFAVHIAQDHGRVVVVSTMAVCALAWHEKINSPRTVIALPGDGQPPVLH